jgi:site-specific recombinase XerD
VKDGSRWLVDARQPMLESLVASGRRSERGVELYRDRYRLHLEPALGRMRIGDVELRHVADVVRDRRARSYAESTIDSTLIVLRGIFRIALRRGLASRSPVDGLDPAELPRPAVGGHGRVLDERELAALVRHARDPYRAVVTVLA